MLRVFIDGIFSQDGRGEALGNMHRELEKCERALNEYLDMKKNVFPRYARLRHDCVHVSWSLASWHRDRHDAYFGRDSEPCTSRSLTWLLYTVAPE